MRAELFACILTLVLLTGCTQAQDVADAPNPTLTVVQDRDSWLYSVGEEAVFLVSLTDGERPLAGEASYQLTLDGAALLDEGTAVIRDGEATIRYALDRPGVVRCAVTVAAGEKELSALAGAAFDPEQIEPTATMPADFVAWWDAQKALLAAIPMDARVEERNAPAGVSALYKVSLANVNGRRNHGWLAVPDGGGPAPALIEFTAAGVGPATPSRAIAGAQRGFLAMHIIHHDFDPEISPERATELREGPLSGYQRAGSESRETYYFYHVILGCVRAIDYLTSRPEYDGGGVFCTGSSQAGGLSLIIAGLDDRVIGLAANVPAMCDHTGVFHGRPSGWPGLLRGREPDDPVAQVAPYFDAVNFARLFDGPALVMVGLIDRTCPAMTVYSAYNVLSGPKEMLVFPSMGHAIPPEWGTYRWDWLCRQAGLTTGEQ